VAVPSDESPRHRAADRKAEEHQDSGHHTTQLARMPAVTTTNGWDSYGNTPSGKTNALGPSSNR